MSEKLEKGTLLHDGLLTALRALDKQVAREMQRTPAEEELLGVQKWNPYQKRIENIVSYLLELFADRTITLDSLLILSQALSKTLKVLIQDLGREHLGEIRSSYCAVALQTIEKDCTAALDILRDKEPLN